MPKAKRPDAPGAVRRDHLPEAESALPELARRHARAVVALLLRAVSLAFLTAVLTIVAPAVRPYRPLLDAASGVLALWPFFTSLGRLYAWRITLGRAYARAGRWADAVRTLGPLQGARARLFDAPGQGRYYLGAALLGEGRGDEADRLFGVLAAEAPEPWRTHAAAAKETRDPEAAVRVEEAEVSPQ